MRVLSIFVLALSFLLLTTCAETNFDPKIRWGSGLKGILKTVVLDAESNSHGPLDKLCGNSTSMPTNCVMTECVLDSVSGWYTSGLLLCQNQPHPIPQGAPSSGLWEGTCGLFTEGLEAGQDEGRSHFLTFTVVKPTTRAAGSIELKIDMKGDIFIMPFAIDKVWVSGIYHFSKSLSLSSTSTFTVADMALECQSDSTVAVDMIKIPCEKFKSEYYDKASCS